ncbi:insulinase family protein [Massilibacteroides sp.]|uniref:M16 family metallopeptidase n=1 Tax=Massilibacteroides sp. TaxID=2034766 RepID=UPI00263350AD|nr:insulinase family protein [Massilibacteroides sp.]MDD4515933.1 insulinase family protein [Massilibacteroides sp.]
MKKILPVALLTLSASVYSAEIPESLRVKEYKLSNGLTVWLNEDHSEPKVFGAVVVKAGSKDCPDTGIAHYFEHMMFKGTDKIGTVDYEAEKVLLDSIATKYDELAQTSDPEKRAKIQLEINQISVRASEYVIPNEFDHLITRYGGSMLNAGTSYDFTVYFNTFSPQYMIQWAEINSERLVNPVFRLFQNELETVYEEKNMYTDRMGGQAIEKLTYRYFYPHPYAYPIVGSTESLKNPRLSEMRKFFEDYYVASNMGLILSGDFDSKEVLSLLERTFSRVRKGEAPVREKVVLPPFRGKETERIKLSIPFVKVLALGFRGVPANHPDEAALKIAVGLLNNENGTGFLDKLMVERKLMAAIAMSESLNEAGILGVGVVPKLLFQTYNSATKLVWREIERVKSGEFSDEMFNSLKLESVRSYNASLEDISSRAQTMMRLYSQGISWEEYVTDLDRINALTKDDVVNAARKYFTENHLYVTKKTGKYPKDNLPKPDYEPIAPKNANAKSDFAKKMEEIPVQELSPRLLDFENDIETEKLSPYVTLYVKQNPVNTIFTFSLSYKIGTLKAPILKQVADYLPFLGTETQSFREFREALQSFGASLSFEANDQTFTIRVNGFDEKFEKTLSLVTSFMETVKADKKNVSQLKDAEKVTLKSFSKSGDDVAKALLEMVKYGEESKFLKKVSFSELKKMTGEELVKSFKKTQMIACDIHYCGAIPLNRVATILKEHLDLDKINKESASPYYRPLITYEEPRVYFYNMPDAGQSIVYAYVPGEPQDEFGKRHAAKLFSGYFGGDMSSLMFQEIREFRSFAYRAFAKYIIPPFVHSDKPGELTASMTTQSDKTTDAISVLDSLIRKMPVKPEKIESIRQTVLNHANNNYPSFREISEKIAQYRMEGYDVDPNYLFINNLYNLDMDDIIRFYENNIADRPVVYMVVGNSRKIDMNELAKFGEVIHIRKKDIIK